LLYKRFSYQAQIDQQEGLFAYVLLNLMQGKNIYQSPDLNFAGVIYFPTFFWFAKIFASITKPSIFLLRAISWVSLAITCISTHQIVRYFAQFKHRHWAWLWIPVFWIHFPFIAWIDIARLEAFYLMWLMSGIAFLIHGKNQFKYLFLSGLCFGIAGITKQSGLLLIGPLFLLALYQHEYWRVLAVYSIICGCGLLIFHLKFGGDIWVWAWSVPIHHPINSMHSIKRHLVTWICTHSSLFLSMIFLLTASIKIKFSSKKDTDNQTIKDNLFILTGCIVVMLLIHFPAVIKMGGGLIDFPIINAFLALAFPVLFVQYLQFKERSFFKDLQLSILSFLCVFTLIGFEYKQCRERVTPKKQYELSYQKLIDYASHRPGKTWFFSAPWISILANKPAFAPIQQALGEWILAKKPIHPSFLKAIEDQTFDTIIAGKDLNYSPEFVELLVKKYNFEPLPKEMVFHHVENDSVNILYVLHRK